MLPFVIGGAIVAAAGFGIKKVLEDSTYCHKCNSEFGITTWKYECSHCNNIFCDDCSYDNDSMKLCRVCNDKYKEKKAAERVKKEKEAEEKESLRKKKEAEEKERYENNLKNWISGTKHEYIKGFNISEDLGLIQINNKECQSPDDVERQLKHEALLINANAYIKLFWDKEMEHHSEEYIAGYGHNGNPYYKTKRHTEKYFTGYATAVILKQNYKKNYDIDNNEYKFVIECSQSLEKYIKKNLNGTGKGLHEKIISIESELSKQDIQDFKFIAATRNKIIHEGIILDDPEKFKTVCKKLKMKYNIKK